MQDERTFERFQQEVKRLLQEQAAKKAYSQMGPDGENRLYEFVQEMSGGHGHALGEVVYKAQRFAALGDDEDVLKIAAWAFLIWRHHRS